MIRVCLVDDHRLVRSGIASLLSLLPDIEVVGEAADGAEALDVIARDAPDVVLLDVRLPRIDGLGVLRALGRWHFAARKSAEFGHLRRRFAQVFDVQVRVVLRGELLGGRRPGQ